MHKYALTQKWNKTKQKEQNSRENNRNKTEEETQVLWKSSTCCVQIEFNEE